MSEGCSWRSTNNGQKMVAVGRLPIFKCDWSDGVNVEHWWLLKPVQGRSERRGKIEEERDYKVNLPEPDTRSPVIREGIFGQLKRRKCTWRSVVGVVSEINGRGCLLQLPAATKLKSGSLSRTACGE